MATVHRCDRCGKEVDSSSLSAAFKPLVPYRTTDYSSNFDLCHECNVALRKWIKNNEGSTPSQEVTETPVARKGFIRRLLRRLLSG